MYVCIVIPGSLHITAELLPAMKSHHIGLDVPGSSQEGWEYIRCRIMPTFCHP